MQPRLISAALTFCSSFTIVVYVQNTCKAIVRPGIAELDRELRAALADSMKNKRPLIGEGMTEYCGQTITKATLDELTRNPTPERVVRPFPALWVPIVCQLTGRDDLQRLLLSQRLRDMLTLGEFVWNLLDEETRRALLRRRARKGKR